MHPPDRASLKPPVIYWFRQDLRTEDLPGLLAAAGSGHPLLCCFILDDLSPGKWAPGTASRWWLHHSLAALSQQLERWGGRLILRRGSAATELLLLAGETGATAVHCSRIHEPWAEQLECELKTRLSSLQIPFRRHPGSLLFEPEQVQTAAGGPFKVFTPFWKACRARPEPARPIGLPPLDFAVDLPGSLALEDLRLLPQDPERESRWAARWQPGSEGARAALQRFLAGAIEHYAESRDFPAREATSRLSPHLHFGELSPRSLWHAVHDCCALRPELARHEEKFLSELGWREFSHHLLSHFPHIAEAPFRPAFGRFPWRRNDDALRSWQQGRTGYPMVDAGMRQLLHTGYQHNRVRMITASFLTKHLLVPWQAGQHWFHETLVDADLANNSCGWQWVAGSGADAAPYFRIFNPTLQGVKFDPEGRYLRTWVPELARLPAKYLHVPATAPQEVLAAAGVVLGETYPWPMVDHKAAREAALAAWASLDQSG